MNDLETLRRALRTVPAAVLDVDVILIEGRRLRCRRRVRLAAVVALATLLASACAGVRLTRVTVAADAAAQPAASTDSAGPGSRPAGNPARTPVNAR